MSCARGYVKGHTYTVCLNFRERYEDKIDHYIVIRATKAAVKLKPEIVPRVTLLSNVAVQCDNVLFNGGTNC